jgi:acetoin utilization deacetylase AcuC-like enzyme
VDTLGTDPLASLDLTIDGFCRVVQEIKSWNLKWVALGGGGYNMINVARAWTKAWAIMKGVEIPDALPESFTDSPHKMNRAVADGARKLAEAVVEMIKTHIFPVVGV